MSLDRLWAGWRMGYVSGAAAKPVGRSGSRAGLPEGCVFCGLLASGEPDEVTYIVSRTEHSFVVLNVFPYTSGHLMVLPLRHVGEMEDLDPHESSELWSSMTKAVTALKKAYEPGGMNLGANIGRAGGAGIPAHLHFHVVPRWNGDTNFMTSVAEARVLPEDLARTWERIRGAWPR